MIGAWATMVLFWGLVLLGIVALVRYCAVHCVTDGRNVPSSGRRMETPTDILRRRYATGELTREQFEQMKREVA